MVRLTVDYVPLDALAPADDLLGVVTFGARHPLASLEVTGMRQLGPRPLAEVWCGEGMYFGTWTTDDDDVEHASRAAYDEILRTIRARGFPHLLRAWNHVRDLNAGRGDEERYRRFCAGRHDAFDAAGWTNRMLPAASGVGMREGSLAVYYVAGREPGRHVENPRQVSAYDYPPQYGRRSPSFARATVTDDVVFVSGTSSVVGHETRHAGDVDAQVEETLINLDAVLREAGTRGLAALQLVKTYVRRAEDYPRIASRLAAALPDAKALFVESDICRADLLVEIDGVARA
ncbi:MAG TPA: Rid family hydrolase [Thermoanaerobaculia bacterium]|nr:Rid family hydrolase [Thermoanaerobaculia bacterium]